MNSLHPQLAAIIAEFETRQNALAQRAADASGHDLRRLKITSPFDARMKYNLYACLKVLPSHQRRHLWQADNVLAQIGTAQSAAKHA